MKGKRRRRKLHVNGATGNPSNPNPPGEIQRKLWDSGIPWEGNLRESRNEQSWGKKNHFDVIEAKLCLPLLLGEEFEFLTR